MLRSCVRSLRRSHLASPRSRRDQIKRAPTHEPQPLVYSDSHTRRLLIVSKLHFHGSSCTVARGEKKTCPILAKQSTWQLGTTSERLSRNRQYRGSEVPMSENVHTGCAGAMGHSHYSFLRRGTMTRTGWSVSQLHCVSVERYDMPRDGAARRRGRGRTEVRGICRVWTCMFCFSSLLIDEHHYRTSLNDPDARLIALKEHHMI